MKYKDRTNAKLKCKKSLLVTVATMTLGIGTLGSTASIFAAEKEKGTYHQQIRQSKRTNTDMDYSELNRWVLQPWSSSVTTTSIKNLVASETTVETMSNFEVDNTKSSSKQDIKTPIRQFKRADTLSSTNGKEISFGQEVLVEASGKANIPLVAEASIKASLKLVAGQKFTSTNTAIHLNEETISFGGDSIPVPAGKKVRVTYLYERMKYSGIATNKKRISDSTFGQDFTANIGSVGVNYWDGKNPTEFDLYHGGLKHYMDSNSVVMRVGYPNFINKHLKTVYDVFSLINTTKNGIPTANLTLHYNFVNKDSYVIPTYILKKHLEIDDNKKAVYIKESETKFEGTIGTTVSVKIEDVKDGKVLYSAPVKRL
ncbi:ETX/MTX2 family pore-forming toxin [Bacillus sp. AR18-7]|uniref:ETX/MTX2 family pore-forming toxin n=1 Tax=Bacillus sp. AR18-7 TaxID=2217821 RepID=UPI0011C874D5|nr:ETX/MTX2 family pore-forming toxin [Bacillus sp. AR18-7]TXR68220.1 hypothetical protein DN395_00555 [Bacillus sp. AR18-7]